MEREVYLKQVLIQVIQRWPVIAFFGILGAVFGYMFSLRNPPRYEAVAVVSYGLNFDRDPPIGQREQDLAEGKVLGYLSSDEVLQAAIAYLSPSSSTGKQLPSFEELRSIIRLERKRSHWEMIVTHEDPILAFILANAWASTAEQAFWNAYTHALRAVDLQTQLDQIEMQLASLKNDPAPDSNNMSEIERLEHLVPQQELIIRDELKLSQGVVTFVSFNVDNNAIIPTEPVIRQVGTLVLSGAVIGIIAGLLYIIVASKLRISWLT